MSTLHSPSNFQHKHITRNKKRYVIIGSGPTGLGAAYRLKEIGVTDFVVLERENYVGGLATSFLDKKGFTWDVGGHVQFSHYRYYDDLMQKTLGTNDWQYLQREAWVWIHNRFVPYPFQNNIRYLPKEIIWKCLKGIFDIHKQTSIRKPANFREWILITFGSGLAEEFMFPYNLKVWAFPPEEMAFDWIVERVAVVDLYQIVRNILLQQDNLDWGPNNTFQFPKHGGTGAIWKAVGERLVGEEYFRLNTTVSAIDPETKLVHCSNGETWEYEYLLSTIPLDLMSNLCANTPGDIRNHAARLKHSSTHIVGFGLKGKPTSELATKCWMYFPEPNSPYYRVTVFSNYSPYNVPDANLHWSLMTETSESPKKVVSRATLVKDTLQSLREDRLINPEHEVVSTFLMSFEYGYPTPSVERDSILSQVLPHFEQRGVFSRGRFGAWKYEVSNQDHSLMQGVEWVNRMELGVPETTLSLIPCAREGA